MSVEEGSQECKRDRAKKETKNLPSFQLAKLNRKVTATMENQFPVSLTKKAKKKKKKKEKKKAIEHWWNRTTDNDSGCFMYLAATFQANTTAVLPMKPHAQFDLFVGVFSLF
jgi:hypothetical protein